VGTQILRSTVSQTTSFDVISQVWRTLEEFGELCVAGQPMVEDNSAYLPGESGNLCKLWRVDGEEGI
jgi:hypothetical protein